MYIFPILSTVGAILVLVGEITKSDKLAPRTTDWPKLMVLFGGVMVIVVALLSAIDAAKQEGRMETLVGETKALVTGGNSYVWLRLVEDPQRPNSFAADLVHGGDNVPSFDIEIEIIETGVCDGLERWTMGNALTSGVGDPRVQFIAGFGPTTIKTLRGRFEPSCDYAYYLVSTQTRNRATVEQIILKKVHGEWRQAIRLQELHNDRTLLTQVDADFFKKGEKMDWPDLNLIRKGLKARFGK